MEVIDPLERLAAHQDQDQEAVAHSGPDDDDDKQEQRDPLARIAAHEQDGQDSSPTGPRRDPLARIAAMGTPRADEAETRIQKAAERTRAPQSDAIPERLRSQNYIEATLRQVGAGALDIAAYGSEIMAQTSPSEAQGRLAEIGADFLRDQAAQLAGYKSQSARAFAARKEAARQRIESQAPDEARVPTGRIGLTPGAPSQRFSRIEDDPRTPVIANELRAFTEAAQEDPLGAFRYTSEVSARAAPSLAAIGGVYAATGGSGAALMAAGTMLETGAQLSEAAHDTPTGERRDITLREGLAAVASGTLAGGAEAIGGKLLGRSISRLLRSSSLDEAAQRELAQSIGRRLRRAGVEATKTSQTEGFTETVQGIITDTGAKLGWDPERDIGTNWVDNYLAGAFLGGGATAATGTASALRRSDTRLPMQRFAKESEVLQPEDATALPTPRFAPDDLAEMRAEAERMTGADLETTRQRLAQFDTQRAATARAIIEREQARRNADGDGQTSPAPEAPTNPISARLQEIQDELDATESGSPWAEEQGADAEGALLDEYAELLSQQARAQQEQPTQESRGTTEERTRLTQQLRAIERAMAATPDGSPDEALLLEDYERTITQLDRIGATGVFPETAPTQAAPTVPSTPRAPQDDATEFGISLSSGTPRATTMERKQVDRSPTLQPWQMTRDEFIKTNISNFVRRDGQRRIAGVDLGATLEPLPEGSQHYGKLTRPPDDILADIHQRIISARLTQQRRGRSPYAPPYEQRIAQTPIPDEVLADYPDLAPTPTESRKPEGEQDQDQDLATIGHRSQTRSESQIEGQIERARAGLRQARADLEEQRKQLREAGPAPQAGSNLFGEQQGDGSPQAQQSELTGMESRSATRDDYATILQPFRDRIRTAQQQLVEAEQEATRARRQNRRAEQEIDFEGQQQQGEQEQETPLEQAAYGRQPFTTSDGEYEVRPQRDGTLQLIRTETGETIDGRSNRYNDALREYFEARSEDMTAQHGYVEPLSPSMSQEEYLEQIAVESDNPKEILENYALARDIEADRARSMEVSPTGMIADYFADGGRILTSSYDEHSDPARRRDGPARTLNYLQGSRGVGLAEKSATTADDLAQTLTEEAGVEITPEDVTNFIDAYPGGPQQYFQEQSGRTSEALASRFQEITGIALTPARAEAITPEPPQVEGDGFPDAPFEPRALYNVEGEEVTPSPDFDTNAYTLRAGEPESARALGRAALSDLREQLALFGVETGTQEVSQDDTASPQGRGPQATPRGERGAPGGTRQQGLAPPEGNRSERGRQVGHQPSLALRPRTGADSQGNRAGRGAESDVSPFGRVLGRLIGEQLAHTKMATLHGKLVHGPEDVAALAQVFRDKRFETMRYILTKRQPDGTEKIVHATGVSSRMPAYTHAFPTDVIKEATLAAKQKNFDKADRIRTDFLRSRMEKHGADGYYLLHNHPSGNMAPSKEDLALTGLHDINIPGFRGHIILDSGEYVLITDDGTGTGLRINVRSLAHRPEALRAGGIDPETMEDTLESPAVFHAQLGASVQGGPGYVATIAKAIESSTRLPVLIGTSASLDVRTIHAVLPEALKQATVEDFVTYGRQNGVTHLFLANVAPGDMMSYKSLYEQGILFEVVPNDGSNSMQERLGKRQALAYNYMVPAAVVEEGGAQYNDPSRRFFELAGIEQEGFSARTGAEPGTSPREAVPKNISTDSQAEPNRTAIGAAIEHTKGGGITGQGTSRARVQQALEQIIVTASKNPNRAGPDAGRERRVPMLQGRTGRDRGFYHRQQQIIRLREAEDLPAAAHEMAHALEKMLWGRSPWQTTSGAFLPEGHQDGYSKEARDALVKAGKALYGDVRPNAGYASEGFSEYMSAYLLSGPEAARKLAPEFHGWFASTFQEAYPDVAQALQDARAQARRWYDVPSAERMAQQIQEQPTNLDELKRMTPGERRRVIGDRFAQEALTQLQPLRRLSREAEALTGEELEITDDPFRTARSMQKTHEGIARHMARSEMVDMFGRQTGPSLKEALAPINASERVDFTIYLWARRALKLWSGGAWTPDGMDADQTREARNPGIGVEDAAVVFKELDNPRFRQAASAVYDWQKGVLDFGRGAFGNEYVDAIQDGDVGDYVPLQRIYDKLASGYQASNEKGGAPVQRLRGSSRAIKDPFNTMIAAAAEYVKAAQERYVLNQIRALADVKGMGRYIRRVSPDVAAQHLPVGRMLEKLVDMGMGDLLAHEGADQDAIIDDMMGVTAVFFTTQHVPPKGEPIIAFQTEGGGVEWFEMDRALYDALGGFNVARLRDVPLVGSVINLAFGIPARMARLGWTGLRPAFALLRNPARDIQTFYTNTRTSAHAPQLAAAYMQSLKESVLYATDQLRGKDTHMRDFEFMRFFYATGLELSRPLGIDSDAVRLATREVFGEKVLKTRDPSTYKSAAHWAIDLARDVMQFPETVPRLTEMRTLAKEAGWDPSQPITEEQALRLMEAARTVTVDFADQGRVAKWINTVTPFFTATIGGQKSAAAAAKRNPLKYVRRGLYMTAATLAYWWMFKDEEWYRDLPLGTKFSYWFIPVPGKDIVIRIPRAYDVGAIFSAIPEALMDAWYRQDPEAVKAAIGKTFDDMNPLSLTLTEAGVPWWEDGPLTATFFAEQLANEKFYFEMPIVPMGESYAPAEEQYGPYTTTAAIWLGETFNASPRRIDHAVETFTGGLGIDAANAMDALLDLAGASERTSRPDREEEAADLPVLGTLFKRGGKAGRSKAVNDFYGLLSEANTRQQSKTPETDEERTTRLMLQDAQNALQALSFVQEHTPDTERRRQLQVYIRRIARDAVETATKHPESALDRRARLDPLDTFNRLRREMPSEEALEFFRQSVEGRIYTPPFRAPYDDGAQSVTGDGAATLPDWITQ